MHPNIFEPKIFEKYCRVASALTDINPSSFRLRRPDCRANDRDSDKAYYPKYLNMKHPN